MKKSLVGFAEYRVLVTGSRGKSSLVRLIAAGIAAAGLAVRGRITGVLPREIGSAGERRIVRNAPGHVEEMRWWLRQIPPATEAVVMENSTVHPDLQGLAVQWLRPSLTVWTNAREDHQDAWGCGHEAAVDALLRGVPDDGTLLLSGELGRSGYVMKRLERRHCPVIVSDDAEAGGRDYRSANLALASAALSALGLGSAEAVTAMRDLPPDVADFRVFLPDERTSLASAFSANDPASTEALFALLGWREDDTSLLFSDRADRRARRMAFAPFLARPWQEVRMLGGDADPDELMTWMRGRRVFGCGNVAGAPLELLARLEREGCKWIFSPTPPM